MFRSSGSTRDERATIKRAEMARSTGDVRERFAVCAVATLMLIAALFLMAQEVSAAARPDNIKAGGAAVTAYGDTDLYFTADEDSGYTFTVTCQNYIAPSFVCEKYDADYDDYYDNMDDTIWFDFVDYPDIVKEQDYECSLYFEKGSSYHIGISFSNMEEDKGTEAKITLKKTNKAGITGDGFSYRSRNCSSNWEWGDSVIITDYVGKGGVVTVPDKIAGMTVDTISNAVFSDNDTITKLIFPEGVHNFRNGVAANCKNLKYVELPSTFDQLANKPFEGCKLESITFPKGNRDYSFKDGFLILKGTNIEGYYGAGTECTVPDGPNMVEAKTFAGTDVQVVHLPKSVKEFRYQFKAIDTIYTPSSYLDITSYMWEHKADPEMYPINIGHIHAPGGSTIEKLAKSYGIDFVPEGECEQYYEIKEIKTSPIDWNMGSYVYIHADDHYYGKVTPAKTGDYCLMVNNGWNNDSDMFDKVTDEAGKEIKMVAIPDDKPYSGKYVFLEAGKTYYLVKDGTNDREYDGTLIQEYLNRYMNVFLIGRMLMYPEDYEDGNPDYDGRLSQPMKASGKTVTIRFAKLKKKTQSVTKSKAYKIKGAKGKLTYSLASAKKGSKSFKKYFKVSKKSGKLTVKKGLKKGKYIVRVKVKASGDSAYKAGSKTVKVTIKVK